MYKNSTRDIILILLSNFFYFASSSLVGSLITGFTADLGGSGMLMGVAGGLMSFCSLFCRPFIGNIVDKLSKYKVSTIGMGLMALACVGYVAAQDPYMILVLRIINGVGFSCCSICISTWMANLLPEDKMGSGMGVYGTMQALAAAIAPSLGIYVFQRTGYRPALSIALVSAIISLLCIQFIHNKGEADRTTDTKSGISIKLIDKRVLPVAITVMLFAIPFFATQSFLVKYAEERNLSISVSLFFMVYAVILLILRLSLKKLFDTAAFELFLFAGVFSGVCGVVFLAVMKNNIEMFLAAFFMAGGYGIMCSVCQARAMLIADKHNRGLANSTYYIGIDAGMTLGPVIGGALFAYLDIQWFYPCLLVTFPLIVIVYFIDRFLTSLKSREEEA